MIKITDKTKCCGCTACESICPKNCITLKPDFEGFLYPSVDESVCVECGACERVCPIINKKAQKDEITASYIIRTKNDEQLMRSTSGGFSLPLAEIFFENGGVVWTATFNENWQVVHACFEKAGKEFEKTYGSKYVQSNLKGVFKEIKQQLNLGRQVCFIGTTCQVYGLKNYLEKDPENLFTVDLVCHGTPSPKLWEKYLDYQRKEFASEFEEVNFRHKTYGYHSGTMMVKFENGKVYNGSARVDYMLKSFFSEISSRPSCYSCAFKTVDRVSDFTVYDCWHAGELCSDIEDDDKGYTNLIVHTKKGARVLDMLSEKCNIYPVDTKRAIAADGVMVCNSATPHPKRRDYYVGLDNATIEEQVQKFIPVTKKDHMIEKSKTLVYKLGLMDKARSMK